MCINTMVGWNKWIDKWVLYFSVSKWVIIVYVRYIYIDIYLS